MASLRVKVPRSERMRNYENIKEQTGSCFGDEAEERLSQPPNTESWSLCGGNDPKVANRNGTTNRTIIKFKRRQGTQPGRKETVARLLKQLSLDTFDRSKWRQCDYAGIQHEQPHTNGKSGFNLPGSKSMARWERDDRNLGKRRDLPERRETNSLRVGGSTQRSEPRWSRGADRLVVERASRLQPAGRPELKINNRRGRQNNVARKGNMDQ